jgi:hypothetical protein
MSNDATRANAQAMPTTRRTALALTGAGLAAALSGFAAHAAMPSTIAAKIRAHAAACRAEEDAVDELERLEAANPIPPAKVQYSWLWRGLDDEGNDIREPLYANTEEAIDRALEPERRVAHLFGSSDGARIEAKKARLVADLREARAVRRAALDVCGITAACEKVERLSDISYDARRAVIEHQFTSLDELRQAVRHIAELRGDAAEYEIYTLACAFAGVEA